MEIPSPVGTGTILPGTENVNTFQCANAQSPAPVMPVEMRRQNLEDAISAASALLGLLAAVLGARDALVHTARPEQLAALCCQTQHALNEAQYEL
jgi:hypothetical protein